ncbi:unnamed protein product, partial [Meganyctiphanes norvegica]
MNNSRPILKGLSCFPKTLEIFKDFVFAELSRVIKHILLTFLKVKHHKTVKRVRNLSESAEKGILSYAIKANSNPSIIKIVREYGATMVTTVSGNEVLLAMKVGYQPENILLNGNGKHRWEVELAVRHGVMLNVDSLFDAEQLVEVVEKYKKSVRVLLRVNPSLDIQDAQTHPHLATALKDSKFGIELQQLDQVLTVLWSSGRIQAEGVHIHVGSAITQVSIYGQMAKVAIEVINKIKNKGWLKAYIMNLGGGLAVENEEEFLPTHSNADKNQCFSTRNDSTSSSYPTAQQLVDEIREQLPEYITLILEPGRSLVASAGVVLTSVLGVKTNCGNTFVVVDAAMTEVIRPALYNAVHPVFPVMLPQSQTESVSVDVVGPVCEGGDFLARRQLLPMPLPKGSGLVVCKTGAYCAAMASNYNMRPLAPEILITSQDSYQIIRSPQTLQHLLRGY